MTSAKHIRHKCRASRGPPRGTPNLMMRTSPVAARIITPAMKKCITNGTPLSKPRGTGGNKQGKSADWDRGRAEIPAENGGSDGSRAFCIGGQNERVSISQWLQTARRRLQY